MVRARSVGDKVPVHGTAEGTKHTTSCPVCQSVLLSILLTPDNVAAERHWLQEFRYQRTRGAHGDKELVAYTQTKLTFVMRCIVCGTLFRDPQPCCEALRRLYTFDTYGKTVLDQLAANQEEFFCRKAEGVKTYLPTSATILEVGSFVGSFLRAAGKLGWRAVGVDVSAEAIAYTRKAGLEVIQGDIQEIELPTAAWDGIFIWNTFDQLCDPGQVLDRAFILLKKQGILALRIPNGDFENSCLQLRGHGWDVRRMNHIMCAQAYSSFLTFPYLTGYTPASICRLLHQHRFTVEAIEGDILVRLADSNTLPFAVQEEERYKRAVRRLCRRLEAVTGHLYHPWLNVLARKGA
jgi:2-polyprenyl-3-methyl-5-hydroxy-6-metoxy-1,4-benzoquinol methylase